MFAKVQHKPPHCKNWHDFIFVSTSIKFVGYEVSTEIDFHTYPFLLSYHEVTLFLLLLLKYEFATVHFAIQLPWSVEEFFLTA